MATIKYFADVNGQAIELTTVGHDGSHSTSVEHFKGFVNGMWHTATRRIEYKSNPSRHECDDRCKFATGKHMKCECSCGGKNHGKGE